MGDLLCAQNPNSPILGPSNMKGNGQPPPSNDQTLCYPKSGSQAKKQGITAGVQNGGRESYPNTLHSIK